jgi:hypothetical protein
VKTPLALVALVAALVVPAARGDTTIGVNDDVGKYADGSSLVFERMALLGLTENVMTVRWDASQPDTIPERELLEHAIPVAQRHGVEIVLDVYPLKALALATDPTAPAAFARFVQEVALAFPTVRQFIVMNECNQPRFLQPQFSGAVVVSAAACGLALALSYDALKALDPGITVWGVGLSPRGNDNPTARDNVSTSPVRFLAALGRWYRASGRTKPLMDGLAFHPYPNSNRDPYELGYRWPKVGAANLDRLYQAFWDAFHGTAQPTFYETGSRSPGPFARISLNEVGIQVSTEGSAAYRGTENVPVVQPADQAAWYARLIATAACDPRVVSLTLFHLVDEADRAGFQSGLFALDGSRRYAADVVRFASRSCAGATHAWRHSEAVAGAAAAFRGLAVEAAVDEDARYTLAVFAVRPGGASKRSIARALASRTTAARPVAAVSGSLTAYRLARLRPPSVPLRTGCYQIGLVLSAQLDPARTTAFAGRVVPVGRRCRGAAR